MLPQWLWVQLIPMLNALYTVVYDCHTTYAVSECSDVTHSGSSTLAYYLTSLPAHEGAMSQVSMFCV